MACITKADDDICKVFISVETIPMLTFVPQAPSWSRTSPSSYCDQSKAFISDDSSESIGDIDHIISQNSSANSQNDMMKRCLKSPPDHSTSVDIIIEDCTNSPSADSLSASRSSADDSFADGSSAQSKDFEKLISDKLNNNVDDVQDALPLVEITSCDDDELSLMPINDDLRHHLSSNLTSTKKDDSDTISPNDFDKLKCIANKLNLQTRRGSYLTWRSRLTESPCLEEETETKRRRLSSANKSDDEKLGVAQRITEALAFIRSELVSK